MKLFVSLHCIHPVFFPSLLKVERNEKKRQKQGENKRCRFYVVFSRCNFTKAFEEAKICTEHTAIYQ
jgi:hypothetical protein